MKALLFLLLFCFSASAQLSIRSPFYVAQVIKPSSGGSAPTAPSGLNVNTVDATGVTLGWTDNSVNEDGFWVEHYGGIGGAIWVPPGAGGDSDPCPTPANATAYFAGVNSTTLGGSQLELSFLKFRVFATNAFGSSTYSSEVQVPPSIAVTDLTGALCDIDDVCLIWTDTGEFESEVRVYRSTNSGMSYSLIATAPSNTSEYVDVDALVSFLIANLRYKVVIVNLGGVGPDSNVATPTP